MDNGHWLYPEAIDLSRWFGFVYRIIDTETGQHYIGKKQFHTHTTKKIKDRKNRKHIKTESKWKIYTGSSTHLNAVIEEKGKDKFLFIIESLHTTKGSLHYAEIDLQVKENVLREKLDNGEKKYYNKCIAGVKFIPPDEIPEETRAKISNSLLNLYTDKENFWYNKLTDDEKNLFDTNFRIGNNNSTKRNKTEEEYNTWLNEHYVGENNPMFGKTGELSPRYGKSPYENLTDERINSIRLLLSIKNTSTGNPRYGKSPHENMSAEELKELSIAMSKMNSGSGNPMYGIPCTYKMTEDEKQQWKNNISAATKGRPKSAETKIKMRKPKGPQRTITCPYCNKEGGASNMLRYHFDNCKHKPTET